ncbi:MAG: hypothetical protein JNK05_23430 [Myxococcales bacterium]|nr:hypothetical protein [Myxococcales bacterium]
MNDGSSDVVADAATQDAPACTQPSPVTDLTWNAGDNFARSIDHHATWVSAGPSGAALYVAGGVRQGPRETLEAVYNQVARAPIMPDGALGPWVEDTALPVPTGFHSVALINGRVYLAGGLTSSGGGSGIAGSRRVFVGERASDGSMMWRESTPLPWNALHPTLTALGNKLVLVGGTDGRSAQSAVTMATVSADGNVGEWSRVANVPEPRSHHIAFVHNDLLYLAGGFRGMPVGNNITPLEVILRSTRDAEGAITGWEEVGTMDPVRSTHSGVLRDRWLYIFGGLDQFTTLAVVQRAPVGCDGRIGAWEEVRGAIPVARGHVHQTPVHEGRVYSVGGRDDNGVSINRVFVGAMR